MTRPSILRRAAAAALLLFASLPPCAAALNCTSGQSTVLALAIPRGTALTLSASLPYGREVFRQRFPVSLLCSLTGAEQPAENLWFHRQIHSGTLGNGLTLFLTLNGERSSEPGSVDSGIRVDNRAAASGQPPRDWQRLNLSVEVTIIKTGATPAGGSAATAIPAQIVLLALGGEQGGQQVELQLQGADRWLSFITESCRVRGSSALNVSLGRVGLRGGRGVGATSRDTPFSINLLCDAASAGNLDVMLQLDGEPPAGLSGGGLVALSAQPLAARGVALQILHATSRAPLELGQPWPVARYPLSDGAVSVPLIARYYQYAPHIQAGKADATLTWTLSYR